MQNKSAREALQTFTGGKGDVLLAYENEAITAQQKGEDIDYVVPDQTILIENPVAVAQGLEEQGDGARRSSTYCTREDGPEGVRREGLPPGDRRARGRGEVPDAARPVHDRRRSVAGRR